MTLAPIKNLGKSLPTQVNVKEMHMFVGLFKHKILSKNIKKKKRPSQQCVWNSYTIAL